MANTMIAFRLVEVRTANILTFFKPISLCSSKSWWLFRESQLETGTVRGLDGYRSILLDANENAMDLWRG